MAETKYTSIFGGMGKGAKPMEGLPRGGRGNSRTHSALRAAADARRDLFSGPGKSNLATLGIKEGYSFTGGPGKSLVDSITFRGSGAYDGGVLNIYKDNAMQQQQQSPAASEDLKIASQNAFNEMTLNAEKNYIVRDPNTGGVIGYTEDSGVTPLPGQTVNIYDRSKTNLMGTLTGGQGDADPTFNPGGAGPGGVNTGSGQSGAQPTFDPGAFLQALQTSSDNTISRMMQAMADERKASDARFAEMNQNFQNQMRQQAANMRQRPQVEGIRFATRGTGGATQQQLRRRGISGTFGRTGDRLMKISSLNI